MINKRTERCNRNNDPVYCIQKIKYKNYEKYTKIHRFVIMHKKKVSEIGINDENRKNNGQIKSYLIL